MWCAAVWVVEMLRIVTIMKYLYLFILAATVAQASEMSFVNCTKSNVFITIPSGRILTLTPGGSPVQFQNAFNPVYNWEGETGTTLDLNTYTNYQNYIVLFGVGTGGLEPEVIDYKNQWDYAMQGIQWGMGSLALWIGVIMVRRVFGGGNSEL